LQAGGGAAGVLIIDDAPGEVPPEIEEMEELVMFMLHLDMAEAATIQALFNDALWQVVGTTEAVLLVNGQSAPTVALQTGKWYRWRVAYAAIQTSMSLVFSAYTGTAVCTMELLAKDGIYLTVRVAFVGLDHHHHHHAPFMIK
jgi:FtsP/CotA-like multicopper oxidase with cupredoxin domain